MAGEENVIVLVRVTTCGSCRCDNCETFVFKINLNTEEVSYVTSSCMLPPNVSSG